MDESNRQVFVQLGVSLLLGLLVGLQRQHSESLLAGLRTFPLITVLGTLAAMVDRSSPSGGWILPCGFLGLAAIVGVGKVGELRRGDPDLGITTEAAILLMYLVGAYVVYGNLVIAIAIGAGVAVLLQFKPELHGIAARLGDSDLRAIMTFALITCIILPVLPNKTYDLVAPLDVLNPFEIWLMVVLIVGISLGSFLLYKLLGERIGLPLGGVLGGLISSTATTFAYARRAREHVESSRPAAAVIVIASAVVFARVILEVAAVAPRHVGAMAPPIAVMMAACALTAWLTWLRVQRTNEQMPPQRNPTELKSAIVFAGLYAGVLMALAATRAYVGNPGLYVVAVLSGLTDMDAITLSASRMVGMDPGHGGIAPSQGWRLIVVAAMANLCFKWMICLLVERGRLAWSVGALFAVPILVGGLLVWLWP